MSHSYWFCSLASRLVALLLGWFVGFVELLEFAVPSEDDAFTGNHRPGPAGQQAAGPAPPCPALRCCTALCRWSAS